MQYDNKWGFEVNHSGGWIVPAGTCFDEAVVFPRYSEFGSYSKFGSNSEIEGVIFTKMMQLQNLDGSGRQVNIIKHSEGIIIRAGCFLGTPEQFCSKALSEGKKTYAAVVKAICDVY